MLVINSPLSTDTLTSDIRVSEDNLKSPKNIKEAEEESGCCGKFSFKLKTPFPLPSQTRTHKHTQNFKKKKQEVHI